MYFLYLFIISITLGRLTPLRTRFCNSHEAGQQNIQILEGVEPSFSPTTDSMCEILMRGRNRRHTLVSLRVQWALSSVTGTRRPAQARTANNASEATNGDVEI